jgi:hypothetical protein
MYVCRCDARLKATSEGPTCNSYTLINERFVSVMGECVILTPQLLITQTELLKIQKSGQFPDELVKIEGTHSFPMIL